MADELHLKILNKGVDTWNNWRSENPETMPDLRHANLTRVNFEDINMRNANLSGALLDNANFSRANFRNSKFGGSSLISTNLNKTDLHAARFIDSDLCFANLRKANLVDTHFFRAKLDSSNFKFAHLHRTRFIDVNLSLVKGLDSIKHYGPSVIDIDSLYRSNGRIPEMFLRGCGIPDEFIAFIPSIINMKEVINFYSCFISYSCKDEEFARKLHARMRQEHLRVWFAPEDIKAGRKLFEQIEHAIQVHDRLLIVLSENSMESEWVITEIRNARKIELKENRRKLFPIRLVDFEKIKNWNCFDSETGKDLAIEVREYFIPDFSDWNDNNSFEYAFERLLRDLKAEESKH